MVLAFLIEAPLCLPMGEIGEPDYRREHKMVRTKWVCSVPKNVRLSTTIRTYMDGASMIHVYKHVHTFTLEKKPRR